MRKLVLILIFFTSIIFIYAQKLEWGFSMGGKNPGYLKDNTGFSIKINPSRYIYTSGIFSDTADFNPTYFSKKIISSGPNEYYIAKYDTLGNCIWAKGIGMSGDMGVTGGGIGHAFLTLDQFSNIYMTGVDQNDIFIAKYDSSGNNIWKKTFGYYGGVDEGLAIALDRSNNVYITGYFIQTVDFDPSTTNTANLTTSSNIDAFVAKYDNNGNYIWAKKYGGSATSTVAGKSIIVDSLSNVYITGTAFNGIFIAKYDSLGNGLWNNYIGGSGYDTGLSLQFDKSENIYLSATFSGTVDFDPSGSISNLTSAGNRDIVIAKYSKSGNYIWAKSFGGSYADVGLGLAKDVSSNIYVTGYYMVEADFDPSSSTTKLAGGFENAFVAKYDSLGNFIWVNNMRSLNGSGYGKAITVDYSGSIYVTGSFSDIVDIDPSANIHNITSQTISNIFIAKYLQDCGSSIVVSINNVKDVTCGKSGYASSSAYGGKSPYSYYWSTTPTTNDSTSLFTAPNTYFLTVADNRNCSIERGVYVNGPYLPANIDLYTHLIANSNFRPGSIQNVELVAGNIGCVPADGSLTLILDSLVSFNSSTPPPSTISGDTLIWNFNNLTFDSLPLKPKIFLYVSPFSNIGDTVCLETRIDPFIGDLDTSNNKGIYSLPIFNSHDPNEKQVYPKGIGSDGSIRNNQKMTYTIKFQNTGSADAINVLIEDALDPNLDSKTLRIIGSSHTMTTEISEGNIIKFKFDNINLPDSGSNEPASNGYVIYEVQQKPNVPPGTKIINTAYIYFDFNSAITTNTVVNTIYQTITNINEKVFDSKVTIYPNPTSNTLNVEFEKEYVTLTITLVDIYGRVVSSKIVHQTSKTQLAIEGFANGIYFLRITNADGRTENLKIVKEYR